MARPVIHGLTRSVDQFYKSGLRKKTSEYTIWTGIKRRCDYSSNPQYHNYGGRGIAMHAEWRNDFMAFLAYVGPRPSPKHSIDRYPNNNGNYEPGNVRWATSAEQNRNRRDNVLLTAFGQTMTRTEWAKKTGINDTTILSRIKRGLSVEMALTAPTPSQRSTQGARS